MRRPLLWIVALAVVFLGSLAYVLLVVRTGTGAPPSVARVNGRPVSLQDLDIRLRELIPQASFHANLPADKLAGLRRTALDELILEQLIIQDAEANGLRAEQVTVDRELASVRQRFASEAELQDALRENGVTESEFRGYLARRVLADAARAAHAPQEPTEDDARAYYTANQAKFLRPEQIRLLEMLVRLDPAGGASAERAAERTANALAQDVRRGQDFATLARKHSGDDWWVKNGDLGWVHRGRLDPDLEQAAFAAAAGDAGVVRSLSGFHVFKVLDRQPPTQLTFDEAKTQILDRLLRQRRESAQSEWYGRLRAGARIEILDATLAATRPLDLRPPAPDSFRPASPVPVAGR